MIQTRDGGLSIEYHDLNDETLAKALVMIDESVTARGGIWLHPRLGEKTQSDRMIWIPAAQLDVHASFGGETPSQAEALETLGLG